MGVLLVTQLQKRFSNSKAIFRAFREVFSEEIENPEHLKWIQKLYAELMTDAQIRDFLSRLIECDDCSEMEKTELLEMIHKKS